VKLHLIKIILIVGFHNRINSFNNKDDSYTKLATPKIESHAEIKNYESNHQQIDTTEQNFNNNRNYINWQGATNNEHQTYAGYLKKQGALFKQWKERYFVLDSLKHQVIIKIYKVLDWILFC